MRKPKFVHGYIDRHGKPRFYFRREGQKQIPLPGLPWSPDFMAAYELAASGQDPRSKKARAGLPGTLRALAVSYYNSDAFRNLKASTQSVRRNIVDRLCHEHGDKRVALMKAEHVKKLMGGRKPESANGLRKALRALMQHAIDEGIRSDDPTLTVKAIPRKNKSGYHRWTDDEIKKFEAKYPIGTMARLAMGLGLFFGQARQDVVAMGPQHIRDNKLEWIRKKTEDQTALELYIPVHPDLRVIIDGTKIGHLTFLTNEFGRPFKPASFGNWWRAQCNAAGLPHCTFHGLRKAAASRLAEEGCTPNEIAAITGHASLKEIERYTKTANRKRLAVSAMDKVKGRTATG